jgi:3-dehydroquinate synthase
MESLSVTLGERSYPIHVGSDLLDAAALYAPYLQGGHAAIVTDTTVAPLYLPRVRGALAQAGARVTEIVLAPGEPAKSWQGLEQVTEALLTAHCGRDCLIIALGGGVVGDLAGFAAAVYQRGVPYVQVPTTLLAQVDSSVGGKTAINHPRGKNMIGAFYQPRAVIADVATLDSLSDRELRAGLAEVIKHGLALDRAFVEWLESDVEKVLARERGALTRAVRRCCELKAAIVAADERESGRRALLNFGHTFGHAIEAATGFGAWLHGEAISAGMVMAAELSRGEGLIGGAEVARVRALLRRAALPVAGPAVAPARLLELMKHDKKSVQGRLRFVLLEAIGQAALRGGVDLQRVSEAILAAAPEPLAARKPL